MAKIGRNQACPCGSGRKYKRCCMRHDRERERLERLESDAISLALTWLVERHGEALEEAFENQYLGALDAEERQRLDELPIELWQMVDINGRELLLAEGELLLEDGEMATSGQLLLGPGGPRMDAVQRTYLETLLRQPLSLYEVVDLVPGERLRLRDLLADSQSERWIDDRAGSATAYEGMVIATRLVAGARVRMSGASYPFLERYVPELLDSLVLALEDVDDPIEERRIRSTIIVERWLASLTAPMPRIVDQSTGEPLLLVTEHYRVLDLQRLDDALRAQPDVEGDRQRGWTRFVEAEPDLRRLLLTINPRGDDRIEAFARTATLAEEGKIWLESLAGDAIAHLTREIVDPTSPKAQRSATRG